VQYCNRGEGIGSIRLLLLSPTHSTPQRKNTSPPSLSVRLPQKENPTAPSRRNQHEIICFSLPAAALPLQTPSPSPRRSPPEPERRSRLPVSLSPALLLRFPSSSLGSLVFHWFESRNPLSPFLNGFRFARLIG
jgi:hypothetical protein